MKKLLLALFILVDLSIMVAAGFFLYGRLTQHPFNVLQAHKMGGGFTPIAPHAQPMTPVNPVAAATDNSLISTSTSTRTTVSSLLPQSTVATSSMPGMRHIAFSYRNSHAHKVDIKADFTQWKSEPMTGKAGVWSYQAALPPGEYQYCFIVDDNKGIRDPTNKRIKQIGTTYVSAVVVSPLPAKPK